MKRASRRRGPRKASMAHVAWLVVRFALQRSVNRLLALTKQRPTAPARKGTDRKRPAGTFLLVLFSVCFFYGGFNTAMHLVHSVALSAEKSGDVVLVDYNTQAWVSWAAIEQDRANAACAAAEKRGRASRKDKGRCGHEWRDQLKKAFQNYAGTEAVSASLEERAARAEELLRIFEGRGTSGFREQRVPKFVFLPSPAVWTRSTEMLGPLGVIAALLSLSAVLLGAVEKQELAKVEWSLEWWFTFPVPARGLFLARILETAVSSYLTWIFLFPFFFTVFWCAGYSFGAVPLGLAATLYIGGLAGALRVVAETTLRRYFSLRSVAKIQAGLWVAALVPVSCVMPGIGSPAWIARLGAFGRSLPSSVLDNPFNPICIAAGGVPGAAAMVGCTLFGAGVLVAAPLLAEWMVRDGLSAGAGPHQGSRRRATRLLDTLAAQGLDVARTAFGSVLRTELLLLLRERSLFAKVFLVPTVLVGLPLLMNGELARTVTRDPRYAAIWALSAASLPLVTGACNTLAMEAPTLWLYSTLPRRLEAALAEKALFWSGVALCIATVAFGAATATGSVSILSAAPHYLLVVLCVVLQAFIATGIGVLGTDPLETELSSRLNTAIPPLIMVLTVVLGSALYTPSIWVKCVHIVLFAGLAAALWQKLRDDVPFLLDPSAAPPARIAVADGMIAVLAFFALQRLLQWSFLAWDWSPGAALFTGFAGAGAAVAAASFLFFRRSGVPNLRATLGLRLVQPNGARALVEAALSGAFAALVARAYLRMVDYVPFLRSLRDGTDSLSPVERVPGLLPWLVVLAVVAAPLFEEFIFRGVLYGGLRRDLRPVPAALATALAFALCHPPLSALPVFVLGVTAAVVYERWRSLPASVVTHMTYNAILVGLGLWWGA